MFGLGAGELIIIAIVALLALGPDKLPGAAKKIGAGIRDLKRQTRDLQNTLEQDHELGDAVRDLKSAMRGEDPPPPRPKRPRPAPPKLTDAGADGATGAPPHTAPTTATKPASESEPSTEPEPEKPEPGSAHG